MGDVALLAAACKAWISENPKGKITLVTRKSFSAFFQFHNHIQLITPDLKGEHKGFFGLFKLFKQIHSYQRFDHVVDAHDVLRTQVLRKFFLLANVPVSIYKKDRNEKKKIIRKENKIRVELKHTVQRYLDAMPGNHVVWKDDYLPVLSFQKEKKDCRKVGIAPFAQHELKVLPEDKIIEILSMLDQECDLYLFGAKGNEYEKLKEFQLNRPRIFIASELCNNLEEELKLIAQMDVMLSMDSANMHMASLVGTPVVSIWGSTHPDLGFKALGNQNDILQVQIPIEDLPCRPCSVFGNTECYRGDKACLQRISSLSVVEKLKIKI